MYTGHDCVLICESESSLYDMRSQTDHFLWALLSGRRRGRSVLMSDIKSKNLGPLKGIKYGSRVMAQCHIDHVYSTDRKKWELLQALIKFFKIMPKQYLISCGALLDCGGPSLIPQCHFILALIVWVILQMKWFFQICIEICSNIKFTLVKKGPLSLLDPKALLILLY